MKNLEILDAGETKLVKLPESLGLLTGLKTLKLRGCKTLVYLPQSIHKMKRLVFVDIAGCSRFARLPENLNEMEALKEIDASETDITEVPCSIGGLNKVKKLSFRGAKGLALPDSIFNLKSLKELNLSYCGLDDGSVPDSFSGLSSLEKLNLSGNLFKKLHVGCISNLLKLRVLFLNSCSELESLPQLGPNLCEVDAEECGSLEAVSDEQLSHLFASINQGIIWIMGESRAVTIPGSEIPSWFENQNDICPNDRG
ncbi:hypothetical protein K1719_046014 [Acacia pycnantha]|nr:hypothetical protein K1719_046014 [Acacia pycnantha]